MKERSALQSSIQEWTEQKRAIDDARVLFELATEAGDEATEREVELSLVAIDTKVEDIELRRLFSGEADRNNAILTINSGAGGTESQDWAQMLLRMYLRYGESKGWKMDVVDSLPGEEAGIKNATITIEGPYAFGYMKAEVGIHRLVRISPFDAQARRHTSFASVFVYPEVEDDIDIEIKDEDLRVDTYRASGAGGQHVNKTSSAIRLTHLPTGIVVACQNERSQHKNRSTAMKLLRARLYELELDKREAEMDKLHAQKKDIAWGSQIRSYVLQPYQLVKDHRTGIEIGKVDAVLDGDLETFIRGYLLAGDRRAQPGSAGASALPD
jgi:peptide chain release factor 2